MYELKQGTQGYVHVVMTDSSGAALTGIVTPTVRIKKRDGASAAKTLSGDWTEDAGIPGCYVLRLSTSDTDTAGPLMFYVTWGSATPFYGLVNVVAKLETDTHALVNEVEAIVLGA